jgi:hypothetical protein
MLRRAIPHLPEPRTLLYPLIHERVSEAVRPLVERLNAWRMMNSGAGLNTTTFDGRPVRYLGSVKFEGSPQVVFWSDFFEPFMLAAARQSIRWVIDHCRDQHLDSESYVVEARGLLGLVVESAYDEMATIDQVLRGASYPSSVRPVNVVRKIQTMKRHVDDLVTAMTHRGERSELRDHLTKLLTREAFDSALKGFHRRGPAPESASQPHLRCHRSLLRM